MRYKSKRAILLWIILMLPISMMAQKHYSELTYPDLKKVKVPEPTRVTLDNGLRLILLEDHEFPFIKMRSEFLAGSYYADPDDKVGLSGLTGQVMRTGGSTSMHGDEIDEALEKIAASVETWISDVWGGASVFTLKNHFDQVAGIFADILMHPAFPEDKIDLAKTQAKSSISRRNDDVTDIANREFNQLIFTGTNFSRDREYATIDAITRDDMIACHQKWVRPNGMVLGIWGDFNTKEMIEKMKALFKDWKPVGDGEVKKIEVPYEYKYTVNLVKKTDVNQSNIYIGHLGGTKDIPDYAALVMMNEILSGGFSSRLFSRVRSDQGLAYAVYGGYGTNFFHPGTFYVHSRTQSERTIEAVRSLITEVHLMTKELVTDEELHVAKEGWLNSYVFNFDSNDEIMQRYVQYAYNNFPPDFLQQTRAAIENVTKEDVLKVAKKYLKPDKVQILVVGNPDDFEEPLSVLGEVKEIDITIPSSKTEVPEASSESIAEAKELILKMAEKMGGLEKMTSLKNTWGKAKLVQGGMEMEASRTMVYPDKLHMSIQLPMSEVAIVKNGEDMWIASSQGTMPAPAQQRAQIEQDLFHDTVTLLKQLDTLQPQYAGETSFNEKAAYDCIVSKGEDSYHLYLDKESLLPLGLKYTMLSQQGPMEVEEYYSDYREVDGILNPFKAEIYSKGEKITEVEALEAKNNIDVDMSIFKME